MTCGGEAGIEKMEQYSSSGAAGQTYTGLLINFTSWNNILLASNAGRVFATKTDGELTNFKLDIYPSIFDPSY